MTAKLIIPYRASDRPPPPNVKESILSAPPVPAVVSGPPLLERLWQAARVRGDSQPTADNLVSWARAFILFHNKRHPAELGLLEVVHFLEHAVKTAAEPLPALAQAARR